jgi:hypothetical protein
VSLAFTLIDKNKSRKFKHAGYVQPVQDRYGLLTMKPGETKSVHEENERERIEYRRWAIVNSGTYYRKTGRTTHRFYTLVDRNGARATITYGIRSGA